MPDRNVFRLSRQFLLLLTLLLVNGCNDRGRLDELDQASRSYKVQRDYASLVTMYKYLHKGMERIEVEALLGEADYSPVEGEYYYSSDRRETENRGKKQISVPVGIVLDYRDEQGMPTDTLRTFRLDRIGE